MIITVHVKGLVNIPTKGIVADWIQKSVYVLPIRDSLQILKHRMKVGGWIKVFSANGNHRKGRAPVLISDIIDFKIKT